MPDIVSNTTPLIALLKIGQLDLLRAVYGRITIPKAVFEEVEQGKDKPYYTDIAQLDWISIQAINDRKAVSYFLDLDAGEAEVIVLAKELEAELVIIDETLGRRFAHHAGLTVTGTIGVLVKAKEMGLVEKISPLLDNMQEKGIWISTKLKEMILAKVGE